MADVIRDVIDKGLKEELNEDSVLWVSEILGQKIEEVLEPHMYRLTRLAQDGAIMSVT